MSGRPHTSEETLHSKPYVRHLGMCLLAPGQHNKTD